MPFLPSEAHQRIAARTGRLDTEEMGESLASAGRAGQLPNLMEVGSRMDEQARERMVGVISDNAADDDLLGATLEPEQQERLWSGVLARSDGLPTRTLQRLGETAAMLDVGGFIPAILSAAERTGVWRPGLELVGSLGSTLDNAGVAQAFSLPAGLMRTAMDRATALGLRDPLRTLKVLSAPDADSVKSTVQLAVGPGADLTGGDAEYAKEVGDSAVDIAAWLTVNAKRTIGRTIGGLREKGRRS